MLVQVELRGSVHQELELLRVLFTPRPLLEHVLVDAKVEADELHHDALGVELAMLCDGLRSTIGAAASHRNGLGGGDRGS